MHNHYSIHPPTNMYHYKHSVYFPNLQPPTSPPHPLVHPEMGVAIPASREPLRTWRAATNPLVCGTSTLWRGGRPWATE